VDGQRFVRPAALLGVTGSMVVAVLQLILLVLMIWWLSRPSQDGMKLPLFTGQFDLLDSGQLHR
jgi:hypothetical protein